MKHAVYGRLRAAISFCTAWLGLVACVREEVPAPAPLPPEPRVTHLYWTDFEHSRIMRAALPDSGAVRIDTLFSGDDGVQWPHGIAVDSARGSVYWAEYAGSRIMAADRQGNGSPCVLYDAGDSVQHPVHLAADPVRRRLYWTEPDHDRICYAPLDGSGRPQVLYDARDGVDGAFGIALAAMGRHVYWTESADNQVVRGDADGVSRPTILYHGVHGLHEPYGLAIDATTGHLYVLDNPLPYLTHPQRKDRLLRGNLHGGGTLTEAGRPGDVRNAYSLSLDARHGYAYWLNQLEESVIVRVNTAGGTAPEVIVRINGIGFGLAIAND